MDIIPLGPGFAAEIRGVTLADVAADDAVYAAVRAAFEDHSVLLFRGQEVSGEGQLAFSRRFGPPETTKVGSLGTGTNFVILTTIGDDGKVVPEDHRYAMRNKANQLWHTDSSFKAVPALTSVLSARTIPDHGGETEFVSTRLAFERLDPALQKKFENSFAWHHYGHSRAKVAEGLATPGGARCAAAAVLAPGVAQSGQRPRRALHRLAHLCDRRHGASGGRTADRGAHRRGDGARHDLRAQVEERRRHHVGQSRHHASRPAVARQRAALHGAHDDLGDRGRRRRDHAPAVVAGGGIAAEGNCPSAHSDGLFPHRALLRIYSTER